VASTEAEKLGISKYYKQTRINKGDILNGTGT